MQNGFLNSHSESIIPSVLKLVEECAKRRIPLVFTVFRNVIGSPFERLIGWEKVREGSETDLYEAFKPFAEIVIEKNYYTAYTREFNQLVEAQGWETILLCGVATESCVLKTAVDVFEKELLPIVIADACASDLGVEMHLQGLSVLEVLLGKNQIMIIDEVLLELDK